MGRLSQQTITKILRQNSISQMEKEKEKTIRENVMFRQIGCVKLTLKF